MSLTQERLKELFDYNQETGELVRKVSVANHLSGEVAGGLMPRGYISVSVDGGRYYAHRIIFVWMMGRDPKDEIDHIDQNRTNNCWENLREVTRTENCKNSRLREDNTSGRVGVCWAKSCQKWVARIYVNKKQVSLGYFESFQDACDARTKAERKYGYHPNHGRQAA